MRSPSEHIKLLQRRVDFLKLREHQNSYDLAEIGSLEWALANLPAKQDPLLVFAQECVLGAYRESELADAAQRAINAAERNK